ncbi:hypothetical protein JHW43_006194 [Diplocarpon mali]|nr:hypothetical protein JHW43_006194 [Diplocarpon mali]
MSPLRLQPPTSNVDLDQDWATFVNYLLPEHAAAVNNDVADRKLNAELIDGRMHRLTLGKESRSMIDLREVDAQLEPLRSTHNEDSSQRLEATLCEWNDGFFKPRGINVSNSNMVTKVAVVEGAGRMPGSWIPWEHEMNPGGTSSSNPNARKGFFNSFMQAGPQGFKMGPIVADNDGFRIGRNGLRADNNGFRIGNILVADSHGFRLGGSRGFNADNNGVSFGGKTWARRESHDSGRGHGCHGHRDHRGRARSHGRHGRRQGRSPSTASGSSFLDSSSSVSDLSVGSLPECEDLSDQQLPVVKQSLTEWLNHPDQPITKEIVRDICQKIQCADDDTSQQKDSDFYALRKDVKDLTKLFKDATKAQRKERRDARKEKKALKKTSRKEQRMSRRAERRIKQEGKKDEKTSVPRGARAGPPWMSRGIPGAFVPSPPGSSCVASSPLPTQPPNPLPDSFPFGRSASVPFMKGLPCGRDHMPPMPPAIAASHNGWPFNQNPSYALLPGGVSAPANPASAAPLADNAEKLHDQALQFEKSAELKELRAIDLQTAATGRDVSETERLKMRDEATRLEEEAEKYRREVDRLRAEAVHLDGEMAREMELEGDGTGNGQGQVSGVGPGSYVQ